MGKDKFMLMGKSCMGYQATSSERWWASTALWFIGGIKNQCIVWLTLSISISSCSPYHFGQTRAQPKWVIWALPFWASKVATHTVSYKFGQARTQPKQIICNLSVWTNRFAIHTGCLYFYNFGQTGMQPRRRVRLFPCWRNRSQPARGARAYLDKQGRNPHGEIALYHFGQTESQPTRRVCTHRLAKIKLQKIKWMKCTRWEDELVQKSRLYDLLVANIVKCKMAPPL